MSLFTQKVGHKGTGGSLRMSLFTQGRVRRYNLWPNDWYACFPKPPEAKQVPSVRTFHGDTFTDPYEWMR